MALDSKNNIKSVFIVDTTLTPITSGTITPGSTPTGSIVIANMSNQVLTTGTVVDFPKIKIIKNRGADLPLQQLVLDINSINAYVGTAGKAATEQVDYVGFNGTSGTIRVLPNNFYTVKLEHMPNSFAYGKRPANYKYGTYQSSTAAAQNSAGQLEVASGLVNSLVQNFRPNRTTDWRVFSELTNSGTRSAAGAAVNMTFTKYSRTVTVAGSTATTNAIVGTYITIGGSAVKTAGVYKVVARPASGVLTLETPYQGENVTILGTVAQIISNANAIAGDWGIKITGIKQKYDVNRWRQYDKVRFNTFLDGFPNDATPTVVTTTAAFDGTAVYEQVANDEYISWGDEGQVFVDQVPPLFREQDAKIDVQYNPVVLGWLDRLPSLIGAGENKGQAIIYISGAAALSAQGLTIVQVLNAWLTGKFTDLPTTLV